MRVALLTNFVPPYRVPVFREIAERVTALRVFVSTRMESNRQWTPDWGELDVVVQKTLTFQRTWRHPDFSEPYELHVPYDTLMQLKRFRPDVILSAELGARTAQAILFGQLFRVPVVLWATVGDHLEASRGRLRALLRRFLAAGLHSVVTNGEGGAAYLRTLGIPDARIHRVGQAVDVELFQRSGPGAPARPRRLLHVGALSGRKGVDRLLDGLALYAGQRPQEQHSLLMVGDGPDRAALQARPLSQNVNVRWIGAVPYDQLPLWYEQADIAIFPTLGDEWGLVVNEALAAGVPVAGSEYAQAVQELIQDGVNGWRFRPDDAASVACVLERALAVDDETLLDMKRQASASGSLMTPARVAEKMTQALQQAMT